MLFSFAVSFLIGAFGVLQNTLNRQIGATLGLSLTLVINCTVLLACSLILFGLLRLAPEAMVDDLYKTKEINAFPWRALLPGVLGFCIVAVAPWTISKIGATRVFIAIIAAQVVTSLLWDYFAEAIPVNASRLAGAGLALAGALLAAR